MTTNSSAPAAIRRRPRLRAALMGVAALVLASCADIKGDPQTLPQDLINRATETIDRFKTLPELAAIKKYIARARAVVVLPSVVKAGFLGAAEGGHGMLLVRDAGGRWSYPAFYTLGAVSFGFQAGIQDTEIVLVLRSEKALQAVLEHQGKFGADTGVTVGFMGLGLEASTTANLGADVLAFAHSKLGLYGGVSLEGAALVRRKDFNEAFYGPGATPRAIVLEGKFANPLADGLRAALGAP